jgi:hypothetical protein
MWRLGHNPENDSGTRKRVTFVLCGGVEPPILKMNQELEREIK